jgi:hypothetical protein
MKRLSLALAGLLAPALLAAQLPDPSTRALGMGGAYASLARGYEAVAWNPSMLAALGRPSFSIGLPHATLELGSNVYGVSDFRKYANRYLSDADKRTLLDKIKPPDSTLSLRSSVGVVPLGLSIGPVGLAVGTAGEVDLGVGKDAVQLALFGNVSRTGPGEFFTARGSSGRGWAATTAAVSYAMPFPMPVGHLSVGVTAKYRIGHFLATAGDLGTRIGVSPSYRATVAGQTIYTDYGNDCGSISVAGSGACGGRAGSGFGIDLGGTLQLARDDITLSAVLVNPLGSMSWSADRLTYERTVRETTQDASGAVTTVTTDSTRLTTAAAIAADPQAKALRDSLLAHANFARLARFGVALKRGPLTVGGAMQIRLASGLDQQYSQLVAGGAEYLVLGVVPLRAGLAWNLAGAVILSGGFGLQLFGVNIDASIASISGSVNPGVRIGTGIGLIF